jgi:hypothetical protein
MKSIQDKKELFHFVKSLSHVSFSNTLNTSKPDFVFIERVIESDILDVEVQFDEPVM